MVWWTLQHTVVVAVMVLVVAVACRFGRFRPAVQHALWVIVLLKFLAPVAIYWPWSVVALCESLGRFDGKVPQTQFIAEEPPRLESQFDSDSVQVLSAEMSSVLPDEFGVQELEFETGSPNSSDLNLKSERSSPIDNVQRHIPQEISADVPPVLAKSSPVSWQQTIGQSVIACSNWIRTGRFFDFLLAVWLVGVAISACYRVRQLLKCSDVVRGRNAPPRWLVRCIREIGTKFGVREPPTLVISGISSPVLWCFGRPKLLWPERLAADDQSQRWRGVIAHELAHLKRRDHWIAWLEMIGGCVWWWNPIFWYVRRQLRDASELSCDAWAMWAVPDAQRTYAETLIEVTQFVSQTGTPVPALGVSTGARRSFERRLTMILSERVPCKVSAVGVLAASLLAALTLPAWSLGQAQNQNPPAVSAPQAAPETAPPLATSPDAKRAIETPSATSPQPPTASNEAIPSATEPATGLPKSQQLGVAVPMKAADGDRISRIEKQLEVLMLEVRALRGSQQDAPRSRPVRNSIAWPTSPDRKLTAAIHDDGSVFLIDISSGNVMSRMQLGRDLQPNSLTFSPEGKFLAVAGGDTMWLLEVPTGKELRRLKVSDGNISALRFSLDGKTILAELQNGKRSQWDVSTGKWTEADDANPVANPPATSLQDLRSFTDRIATPTSPKLAAPQTSVAPPATESNVIRVGPSVESSGGSSSSISLAGAQLDLVRLATDYIEAVGAEKKAKRHFEHVRTLPRGAISESDVATAEVDFETASNKRNLLRAIAQSAADATAADLEHHKRLVAKGFASPSSEAQYSAKLTILKMILEGSATSRK